MATVLPPRRAHAHQKGGWKGEEHNNSKMFTRHRAWDEPVEPIFPLVPVEEQEQEEGYKRRYCRQGHDTQVYGRRKTRECTACYKERQRGVVFSNWTPKKKVPFLTQQNIENFIPTSYFRGDYYKWEMEDPEMFEPDLSRLVGHQIWSGWPENEGAVILMGLVEHLPDMDLEKRTNGTKRHARGGTPSPPWEAREEPTQEEIEEAWVWVAST